MRSNISPVLYAGLLIVIIVAVDFVFFRHHFRERLIANIAIVLAFVVFYLLYLKRK